MTLTTFLISVGLKILLTIIGLIIAFIIIYKYCQLINRESKAKDI